jgi:hypothetical protein
MSALDVSNVLHGFACAGAYDGVMFGALCAHVAANAHMFHGDMQVLPGQPPPRPARLRCAGLPQRVTHLSNVSPALTEKCDLLSVDTGSYIACRRSARWPSLSVVTGPCDPCRRSAWWLSLSVVTACHWFV